MTHAVLAPAPANAAALYPRLSSFVRRALAGLGVAPADLDDLTQDVFITLHRRGCTFDDDRAARAWLYAASRRIASNHRRAGQRRRRRVVHAPVPEAPADPQATLERVQLRRLVDRVAGTLSPDAQAVFRLAEREGLSGPEISERLGLPLNTTYSHLRRARARMRRVILAVAMLILLAVSMLAGTCATEGADERPRVALRAHADAAG